MMLNTARSHIARACVRSVRHQSTKVGKPLVPPNILTRWYSVFGKSNAGYASWIVMGILVGEAFTGGFTNMIWNSINHGKTYETVDWSKFKSDDDDEEEEEEGEEEEEEEDDDDDE